MSRLSTVRDRGRQTLQTELDVSRGQTYKLIATVILSRPTY